ncbi:MAG: DUF4143 domain-containing protein [Acidobacteria bacterium]|nr:DUF4143 domain-containing protein [Acidobacteriota bacterium]
MYASADGPLLEERLWIEQQWDQARLQARSAPSAGALLVLDEVQKVSGWSEVIKQLWDEDTAAGVSLKVLLLGSSPLLMERGLTESLAGRFEVIRAPHWSFSEMENAFGWKLDQFIYFGGYPGAAPLIEDHDRWARYILDSLMETAVSRDILLMSRIEKPALLRRLFQLGCEYSSQVLSYQKMLGQLHDAGNTTTLAHYLDLLSAAGLLGGISKFSGQRVRQRASSPKLQVFNTALMTASTALSCHEARRKPDFWGRLLESAVGAHLINDGSGSSIEVFYWRERNREVDFVLRKGQRVTAIEVKSGRKKSSLPGMKAFDAVFRPQRKLLVGVQGIKAEEFFRTTVEHWIS